MFGSVLFVYETVFVGGLFVIVEEGIISWSYISPVVAGSTHVLRYLQRLDPYALLEFVI